MKILVTGCAGFIGMHVCRFLLDRGDEVIGIDDLNGYYEPRLKIGRLRILQSRSNFSFHKQSIVDADAVNRIFQEQRPRRVVNLAAQAGVRYSLENPHVYAQSNLVGFLNILEACRAARVEHCVYASSSSVYGSNERVPFSVHDNVDHPVSLYAATKKANELMAHTYSHVYGLPTTGLRYFTVYGPWGRPDMSPWIFSEAILAGQPLNLFNRGNMRRDFTFVDDIAEGTVRVLDRVAAPDAFFSPAAPDPATSHAPYRLYNIGNSDPVELLDFVQALELGLGKKANRVLQPMQPGDVKATYADVSDLKRDTGFAPTTNLSVGVARWCEWFTNYRRAEVDYRAC